eukprot:3650826-Prymnesium_polylepis.1
MVCDETISIEAPRCVAGAVAEAPIFAKDRQGNQVRTDRCERGRGGGLRRRAAEEGCCSGGRAVCAILGRGGPY